jgi:hypothetical protein
LGSGSHNFPKLVNLFLTNVYFEINRRKASLLYQTIYIKLFGIEKEGKLARLMMALPIPVYNYVKERKNITVNTLAHNGTLTLIYPLPFICRHMTLKGY